MCFELVRSTVLIVYLKTRVDGRICRGLGISFQRKERVNLIYLFAERMACWRRRE